MQNILRKFALAVMALTLLFAALPQISVFAAGAGDTPTPPAPGRQVDPAAVAARLELTFSRQQMRVFILGQMVRNYDFVSANIQKLLDKAKQRGLDIAEVQAAFDAYRTAFEKGKPLVAQAQALVDSRPGFDSAGKVTDAAQARATVMSLADVLKQYRDTVGEAFRSLRDAVRTFRQANPRPSPTPAP
jgi:hypothetical protein